MPPSSSPWNPSPPPVPTAGPFVPAPSADAAAPWMRPAADTGPWAPATAPGSDGEPSRRSGSRAWAVGLVTLLVLGVGGYVLVDRLTADAPTGEVAGGTTGAESSFGAPDDGAAAPASESSAGPAGGRGGAAAAGVGDGDLPGRAGDRRGGRPRHVRAAAHPRRPAGDGVALRGCRDRRPARLRVRGAGDGHVGRPHPWLRQDRPDGRHRPVPRQLHRDGGPVALRRRAGVSATHPAPRPALTVSNLPAEATTTRVVLEITGTGNAGAERPFTAISDVAFRGYRAGTR